MEKLSVMVLSLIAIAAVAQAKDVSNTVQPTAASMPALATPSSGAAIGGIGGFLAGLGIMAIPGVGPVVAAGWLAAMLTGAAAGAVAGAAVGGLVSAFTKAGVTDQEAEVLAEHVRRGGAVICVRADDTLADKVRTILRNNSSIDLAIRRRSFEQDGWTGFNPSAQPYNAHEVQAERTRHNQR